MILRMKGNELYLPVIMPGEIKTSPQMEAVIVMKIALPLELMDSISNSMVVQKLFIFLIKSSAYMFIIFHD